LLCWNAGQESPIHDHPCDGCWLQVLQGQIREVRYGTQLQCVADDTYKEGQLSYITNNMGYHKVGNPTNTPSVTLHLYAPPFQKCQCWHTEDQTHPSEGVSTNYSEYGIKV
jgi:cysteine dioxygenase